MIGVSKFCEAVTMSSNEIHSIILPGGSSFQGFSIRATCQGYGELPMTYICPWLYEQ